ncbi:MAG: GspH/FimT family protein [Candidatus Hydrogenedentes bacterium]|nr:GspH/FimT family protein [Candidatus Hydrogenedentota bacterium]
MRTDRKARTTTLPTTGEKTSDSRQGFTLIELLLVVALIALLTGIMFPRLSRTVRSRALSEGIQEIGEFVRFARVEAVRRRLRTQIVIDKSHTEFWLEIQDAEAAYQEQFVEFGDAFLDEHRRLPAGVRIERIYKGDQPTALDSIVFTPDGVGEPYTIVLTDQDGRRGEVNIPEWYEDDAASARTAAAGEATDEESD